MADETERWSRVQKETRTREPFQAKASPAALHTNPERRRNLDKEEAARDRQIFHWLVLIFGILALLGILVFVVTHL